MFFSGLPGQVMVVAGLGKAQGLKGQTMEIIQLPCLMDNYAYLFICPKTQAVGLVDTPDAPLVLGYLKKRGLVPSAILNTHHHWDHAGGNQQICEHFDLPVYCSEYDRDRIDGVTKTLKEGDTVAVGSLQFEVFDVPGHTLGHIAYYRPGVLFCGDTLFVGGCGRLFEGTPGQMLYSLKKLKALPNETLVYCAHEYTEKNLSFAMTLEPGNRALAEKLKEVRARRARGESTVPSTIAQEKAYNPFLRWDSPEIIENLNKKGYSGLEDEVAVFSAVRQLKDLF